MNIFQNLLSSEFKQLYNDAIDTIIDPNNGLVNPCKLRYGSSITQSVVCNNCLYDSISNLSSNIYNGTGPKPFDDGGVCPVCFGSGYTTGSSIAKEETINIAVITDSKYFINIADALNLNNNHIQILCKIEQLSKLQNAIELVLHGIAYQQAGEPQLCGLSKHKYAFMLWRTK